MAAWKMFQLVLDVLVTSDAGTLPTTEQMSEAVTGSLEEAADIIEGCSAIPGDGTLHVSLKSLSAMVPIDEPVYDPSDPANR